MVLQMGNTIEVAPGIRLRQLSNLGRTYQDLFFWSATGRTHVLGVSGRGIAMATSKSIPVLVP